MSKPSLSCLCASPRWDGRSLRSPQKLENRIIDLISRIAQNGRRTAASAPTASRTYRAKKFVGYLEAEYQKLSEIEHAVGLENHASRRVSGVVAFRNSETTMTLGERVADKVAQFGGSWRFISLFGGILVAWMIVNAWVLARHPFDPTRSFS